MSQLTKYERARAQIARWRERSEAMAETTMGGAVTIMGGFAAGALDAKLGKVPNTNFDAAGALGAVGAAISLTGYAGKHSDQVGRFAFGALAYVAGKEGYKFAS